jgi:hypothetical protein
MGADLARKIKGVILTLRAAPQHTHENKRTGQQTISLRQTGTKSQTSGLGASIFHAYTLSIANLPAA